MPVSNTNGLCLVGADGASENATVDAEERVSLGVVNVLELEVKTVVISSVMTSGVLVLAELSEMRWKCTAVAGRQGRHLIYC